MNSIGDTLRRERQRRNLEIVKVSGELKISAKFLEAMERDDFAKLPGGVFAKSFVRQYAAFLGLDTEEIVAVVERATQPAPEVSHVPDKPKPDVPVMEFGGADDWQSLGEHRVLLPSWLKAGALLVALMLVCSAVYWWWQRPHHPVLAHEAPPPQTARQVASPATQPAPPPIPAPVPVAAASPPAAAPVEDATAKPPAAPPPVSNTEPNPNATVRVGITADEEVWVRADVNGVYKFSGTLQPRESRNIDADGEVILRLGNAGGASLTLNGKPVGAVGPKGQIRTIQFTSGGFQIVSPPKVLDPLDRL